MRCRRARTALVERGMGLLDRRQVLELARHLERCEACGAEALAERQFRASMRQLQGSVPFEIDVRERVAQAIGRARPAPVETVATASLGWAAALATLMTGGLAVWFWALLPEARALAHSVALSAAIGLELGSLFLSAIKTTLAVPMRLLGDLLQGLYAMAPSIDSVRPLAGATMTLACMVMIGTILLVVGRDLRRRPAIGLDEERR